MKLIIKEAAERDILLQADYYAAQGLEDIARRFSRAAVAAIKALAKMPEAGAPRPIANPDLAGLRSWRLQGFNDFRIYYAIHAEMLIVLRVLHSKQDTIRILEREQKFGNE